jgi:uncharacterized damage-inducible protein DinB
LQGDTIIGIPEQASEGAHMENQSLSALSNREFFIRRLSQEYQAFVDICRALPPDKLDYRPHPASRSAGELVAMLVSVQQSSIDLCEKGSSSLNSGMQFHPTSPMTTLEQMLTAFQQHHRRLIEKVSALDDATWDRPAWLMQGKQEIIIKDTVGGLLWIALFDAVHHRGQLSSYIRPMGGKVPSIYGPSADTAAQK